MEAKETEIIILNWNGGRDTWLCIESVLDLDAVRIRIVDNNSSDDSISFIRGQLESRNIPYIRMGMEEVQSLPSVSAKVTIILSQENLGFAKGVNRVLRPLLSSGAAYCWLLNNDALATTETLRRLQELMESDPHYAFTGSVILDEQDRGRIQCCGVRYYKWLGVAKMQLKNRDWNSISREKLRGLKIDFQHGASLLVRLQALRKIGLMDERFFLYAEEHDWQYRAAAAGYLNGLAAQSIIYHKGSMSTNSKRHLFFYHYSRSSVLFSRKHYYLFTAMIASLMLTGITLIRTRLNIKSMGWALKGMREAWLTSHG